MGGGGGEGERGREGRKGLIEEHRGRRSGGAGL